MPDMIETGAQFLASQMLKHMSSKFEYLRGDDPPKPFDASTGRTLFAVNVDGVKTSVWTDKDFLTGGAVLAGLGIVEPERGDRVREVVRVGTSEIERIYLVSAPGDEQPWRNEDGRNAIVRIHTKLFAENPIT
jgi:hypothetical protein